ncbi:MAG: DciA family protein [Thermoleophilaceae bacterium]
MRRAGPRPLGVALETATGLARPRTLLARVQAVWSHAVGPAVAAESEPVSERDRAVSVTCTSAVWAQELELLEPDLRERLNGALRGDPDASVRVLEFRIRRSR